MARRLVDEADASDPGQAAIVNLRGLILLAQEDFDGAQRAFEKSSEIEPTFREAQYNMAQILFRKKEYSRARDRFTDLLKDTTTEAKKINTVQMIGFKIYLTLLLEGHEQRAWDMLDGFNKEDQKPAYYYGQAAWAFDHKMSARANDWIASAKKMFPLPINLAFAEAFYDLGWLVRPTTPPPTPSRDKLARP